MRAVPSSRYRVFCAVLLAGVLASASSAAVPPVITTFTTNSYRGYQSPVSVVGSSFTGVTNVLINGHPVKYIKVVSDVSLQFQVPTSYQSSELTGPITLQGPGGSTTSTNNFSVSTTPQLLTGFCTRDTSGYKLLLDGNGLGDVSSVDLGSGSVPFTKVSDWRLAVPLAQLLTNNVTASVVSGVTTAQTVVTYNRYGLINGIAPGVAGQFDMNRIQNDGSPQSAGGSATYQGIDGWVRVAANFIASYYRYIDIGAGTAKSLADPALSTFTMSPTFTAPNEITSAGTFVGSAANTIAWTNVSSVSPGGSVYNMKLTFTAQSGTLGTLKMRPYIDEDCEGSSDDLFTTNGTAAAGDLQLLMLDTGRRFGFSMDGTCVATPDVLVNATFDGFGAGQYSTLRNQIINRTQVYGMNANPGGGAAFNVNTTGIAVSNNDFEYGTIYVGDVSGTLSWTVNPGDTTATISTRLVNRFVSGPAMQVMGTNGEVIATSESASQAKGTYFDSAVTRSFAITNPGTASLTLSGCSTSGPGASSFTVSPVSGSVALAGGTNFTITFDPQSIGIVTAAVSIANDSGQNPYVVKVVGERSKSSQTITFANPGAQYTTNSLGLSATASSGLPVSFAVGSGSASIADGTNLSFSGAGDVSIVASQAGDSTYFAAPNVTNTFAVSKTSQTIDFPSISDQNVTSTVSLAATASSGLTVAFTNTSGSPVNWIDADTISFSGTGTVGIIASQAGNGMWNAASCVTNTFNVSDTYQPSTLSAPTGVSATDGTYGNKVVVSWNSVSGATSYEVWRSTNSSSSSAGILTSGVTTNVYDDTAPSPQPRTVYYYWVKAANTTTTSEFSVADSGYRRPNTYADYSGDGSTDMAVYDQSTGTWYIRDSLGNIVANAAQWGGPGYRSVPGDYDGDGVNDLAVYDTATGTWYVRTMQGTVILNGVQYGGPGYAPVTGDYDGDGINDLAVYDQSTGTWYIRTVAGTEILAGVQWGGSTFTPVPGDYDGDGIDDLAMYDQSTGMWYIRTVSGTVLANGIQWGGSGFAVVQGDFDGDGADDLAVYEQSTGKWYVRTLSGTTVIDGTQFGGAGYAALAGDYNGDGTSDLAVYDSATGQWYIQSVTGTPVVSGDQWGGSGYTPSTETDAPSKPAGLAVVYRLFSYGHERSTYEHFFTSSYDEAAYTVGLAWWNYECVAWYALPMQSGEAVPLYRAYNLSTYTHYWSTDANVFDTLVSEGWLGEGAVMYVWATASGGRLPVYQFYNATLGKYLFTADENEKGALLSDAAYGYTYQGIAFYVYDSP